jgi:uncharacterized protein (TIGR03437 family)
MSTKQLWLVRIVGCLATACVAAAAGRVVYGTYLPIFDAPPPAIALDNSGNTYYAASRLTGPPGSPGTTVEAFVARVAAGGGSQVEIGTVPYANATALAVDPAGGLYLAGTISDSSGFAATAGVFQTDQGSGFVARLDAAGKLVWASRISATPSAIALDGGGNIYLAGSAGADFRTTAGVLKSSIGEARCSDPKGIATFACTDAFVAKVSPDGTKLLYATFLGGTLDDVAVAIAVDSGGSAYVAGWTLSADFPATAAAFQPRYGGGVTLGPLSWGDGFAARLDPSGSKLVYVTFLGGSNVDFASGIAVDPEQNAYVTGTTRSRDFPVTSNAWQKTYGGDRNALPAARGDAFYVKLDAGGRAAYASYLGGADEDTGGPVALGGGGRVVLAVSGTVAAMLDKRAAGPCEPSSTLVLVDAESGSVVEHEGLRPLHTTAVAVDGSGIVHAAGSTPRVTDSFALSTNAIATLGDAFLALVDFARTDDLVPACLLNAASRIPASAYFRTETFLPTPLSIGPGELIDIFGTQLATESAVAQPGPKGELPTQLAGIQVLIGITFPSGPTVSEPIPLISVSPNQIRAAVPYDRAPGDYVFRILRLGQATPMYGIEIAPARSGVFTADGSGTGLAAAVNEDGTPNGQDNPAVRGSVISLYATGLGAVSPPAHGGTVNPVAPPWLLPAEHFDVYISSTEKLDVLWAGAAPGLAPGVYQVNVRVPADAPMPRMLLKFAFDPPGWDRSQDVFVYVR